MPDGWGQLKSQEGRWGYQFARSDSYPWQLPARDAVLWATNRSIQPAGIPAQEYLTPGHADERGLPASAEDGQPGHPSLKSDRPGVSDPAQLHQPKPGSRI